MARIADEVIERIKSEVSLVRLAESQGYALEKSGKDFVLCCPFHEEKTPSCKITPAKNLFNCLGCGVGGSNIDWYMKTERVSFRRAADVLQRELGVVTSPLVAQSVCVAPPSLPMSTDANDQELLTRVVEFYRNTLVQSPEALDYLKSRGLDHPELISTFNLGFANRTLAYQLPHKRRLVGVQQRGRLQELGVLRASGHEHLNGSIVVPLYDQHNNITQLYGRKICNRLRKGTPDHLYLEQPKVGIFNHAGLVGCKEIILCEALIDAMTFWCAGFRNVTSALGAGSFNDELLAYFKQLGVERVLIAFDRDKAGNDNAEIVAKKLNQNGIDAFRVLFPKGMDANEYALNVTPANKSLDVAVRKAEWLGNGIGREKPVEQIDSVVELKTEIQTATKGEVMSEIETVSAVDSSTLEMKPSILAAAVAVEVTDLEVNLTLENRLYRVRGLNKNTSHELLKINLLVKCENSFYVDTLDLYSAKARAVYIKQSAAELGLDESVLKSDLGAVLLQLEEIQDQLIRGTLSKTEKRPMMSEEELNAAMQLLKSPNLMNQILADFARCGVVGEEANKLVAYLACVSRKMKKPLAVLIQSTSAAGKTSLMDAVLNMMPEEERIQYSAMTGQSLYYMGEKDLKHKILAIAEEEGASNASYALKLLQSEGKVTIASTGKNAATGNLETQDYTVEGPVALFYTTTAIDIDEELKNRCITLSVDESREQTAAIHEQQRYGETLEGILAGAQQQEIISVHNNAQRLLRPLVVSNSFANHMTFLNDKTRTRRDHMKYLSLIKTIALLHQFQREVKRTKNHKGETLEYIEVELSDIEAANQLANEVLGRTLDELTPQTRRMLNELQQMIAAECKKENVAQQDYRFGRAQLRQHLGWSYDQVRVHLERLVEMEYVLVHRGKRGQSFDYELLYRGEGQAGNSFLMGLMDVEALQKNVSSAPKNTGTTLSVGGKTPELVPPLGGHWGTSGVGVVDEKIAKNTEKNSVQVDLLEEVTQNALIEKLNGIASHLHVEV